VLADELGFRGKTLVGLVGEVTGSYGLGLGLGLGVGVVMLSMRLSMVGSSVYFSLRCVTVSVFMLGGLDFLEDENLKFMGVMVVC
jgi:hypothetical protein